jgi:hypothetical protein
MERNVFMTQGYYNNNVLQYNHFPKSVIPSIYYTQIDRSLPVNTYTQSFFYYNDYWGMQSYKKDIRHILLPTPLPKPVLQEKFFPEEFVIPEDLIDFFPHFKVKKPLSDLNVCSPSFTPMQSPREETFFNLDSVTECELE